MVRIFKKSTMFVDTLEVFHWECPHRAFEQYRVVKTVQCETLEQAIKEAGMSGPVEGRTWKLRNWIEGPMGVNGKPHLLIRGQWWRLANGGCRDGWDIELCTEEPVFLDTADSDAVAKWCYDHDAHPWKDWPAVVDIVTAPWRNQIRPGSNIIDMQFDRPGWQLEGCKIYFTLADGTIITSGERYQRGVSVIRPGSERHIEEATTRNATRRRREREETAS